MPGMQNTHTTDLLYQLHRISMFQTNQESQTEISLKNWEVENIEGTVSNKWLAFKQQKIASNNQKNGKLKA